MTSTNAQSTISQSAIMKGMSMCVTTTTKVAMGAMVLDEVATALLQENIRLMRERDERQGLLERVFGKSCLDCSYRISSVCIYATDFIKTFGRRSDCPFLKFEVKK